MCKGGVGGGQSPFGDFAMSKAPDIYARAQTIANAPFIPYTGPLAPQVPAALGQAQTAAQGVSTYRPPMANAPTMRAASSGVYGLLPSGGLTMGQPAPVPAMPTGAPTAPTAPLSRPARGAYTDRAQYRDAMGAYRDQRRGGGMMPPPVSTPGVPGGTGGPAQPSVAAMQGLQGLDAYMNPYTRSVTDRTLAGLDQFRQMALNQNASGAAMSGAFSNDRLGVENALTNEGFARQAADALANLNMQGFNTGAGLLMGDKAALLQNQQFNAGLQQQASLANQQAGLAGSLANQQAATDAARVNLGGAQTLGQLGAQQYGMEADPIQAAYQEFLRQQAYAYQQQDALIKSLGGVGNVMGSQWTPADHPFADAFLGSLGSGLGGAIVGGGNAGLNGQNPGVSKSLWGK
jgi:hypothetical protein